MLQLMFPYQSLSSYFQSQHDTTQAVSDFWSSPELNLIDEVLGATRPQSELLGSARTCGPVIERKEMCGRQARCSKESKLMRLTAEARWLEGSISNS